MVIFKTSALFIVGFSLLSAVHGASNGNIGKRSPFLEGRQECPGGDIPACPTGIPCVPPGAICCSDGITYVMPPDTCPDGTNPVATAVPGGYSTPGSGSSSTPTPSSQSSSVVVPTSTPSSSAVPTSSSVPSGTGISPSKSSSSPLPIFTGAASNVQAGLMVLVPAAVGVMIL